jgi:hypothetical protein
MYTQHIDYPCAGLILKDMFCSDFPLPVLLCELGILRGGGGDVTDSGSLLLQRRRRRYYF